MPFYRNNAGTAEEIQFYVNQGGTAVPINLYENQTGTAVELSTHVNLGTAISLPLPDNSDSSSDLNGVYCNVADTPIAGVRLTIDDDSGDTYDPSGYTHAEAIDGNGNSISPRKDVSGLNPGDTFDLMFDSSRTADFGVGLDAGGSSYTRSRYETPSYPYTGDEMDVSDGMYSSAPSLTSNVLYNFSEIVPILE